MAHIAKPQRVDLTRQCLNSIQDYISSNQLKPGE